MSTLCRPGAGDLGKEQELPCQPSVGLLLGTLAKTKSSTLVLTVVYTKLHKIINAKKLFKAYRPHADKSLGEAPLGA